MAEAKVKAGLPPLARGALGVSGLKQWYGRVYEEWLPELQQERGRQAFRQIADQDSVVGAFLFAIEMLSRGVDWYTQPSETDTNGEVAFFVEQCRGDMGSTWSNMIASVLSFLVYGWSLHEIEYKIRRGWQPPEDPTNPDAPYLPSSKYNDGKVGWEDFSIRGQDTLWRWEFGTRGQILGMYQQPPPDYIMRFVPMMKSLLFRTTVRKNNPEGRSVIRNAHWDVTAKKRIEIAEGIGIERDLAGMPVGLIPASLLAPNPNQDDAATLDALKKSVQDVRRDEQEGLLWPSDRDENGNLLYELKLLASPGRRQFDTDKIVARHNRQIAMVVLADFILMGHEQGGSQSLVNSRTELFSSALKAWLDMIAAEINTKAIPDLLRYNGISLDKAPTIQHTNIVNISLQDLGTFIVNLAQAGYPMAQMKNVLKYALEQGNMPYEDYDIPQEPDPNEDEQAEDPNEEVDETPDKEKSEEKDESNPQSSKTKDGYKKTTKSVLKSAKPGKRAGIKEGDLEG